MKEVVEFENLEKSDLFIDCVYKGGSAPNKSAEPLPKLIPRCQNSGGFRNKFREDGSGKLAYVVLYTTMTELEWPDFLDEETGVFRYYGDNRSPGKALTDTRKKGNKVLEDTFEILHSGKHLDDIPPFFVFKKAGEGRSVKFLGLAAPGNPNLSSDNDLVAFWRTIKDNRFQNYEAYFTILDTGDEPIRRDWIKELITDHKSAMEHAPGAWKEFIHKGRSGINALKAKRIFSIPSKYDQLQSDVQGRKTLQIIRDHYKDFPQGFEACATRIVQIMDHNFTDFSLTRPWRDGGRDALGHYSINPPGIANAALRMDCALEAKCYAENVGVGVRQMSRLISRIRYRQFGVLVTTSYVDKQAYEEVIDDGHPVLIITATDIAAALRRNSIYANDAEDWLSSIDKQDSRISTYYYRLNKVKIVKQ